MRVLAGERKSARAVKSVDDVVFSIIFLAAAFMSPSTDHTGNKWPRQTATSTVRSGDSFSRSVFVIGLQAGSVAHR